MPSQVTGKIMLNYQKSHHETVRITEITKLQNEKTQLTDGELKSKTFSPVKLQKFFCRIGIRSNSKSSTKKRRKRHGNLEIENDQKGQLGPKISHDTSKISCTDGGYLLQKLGANNYDDSRLSLAQTLINDPSSPDPTSFRDESLSEANTLQRSKSRFKTKIVKIINIKRRPRKVKSRSLYSVSCSLSASISSRKRKCSMRKRLMHPLRTIRRRRCKLVEQENWPYTEETDIIGRHSKCRKWCKNSRKKRKFATKQRENVYIGHHKCKKWLDENILVDLGECSSPPTGFICDSCQNRMPSSRSVNPNSRFKRRLSAIFGKFKKTEGMLGDGAELTKLPRNVPFLRTSIVSSLRSPHSPSIGRTYNFSSLERIDDNSGEFEDSADDSLSDIPEVRPTLRRFFADDDVETIRHPNEPISLCYMCKNVPPTAEDQLLKL